MSSNDSAVVGAVVLGVLAVGLTVGIIAVTIKNHSSFQFRKFKQEILKIDYLLKNKSSDIVNFKMIHSEILNAEHFYTNALNSGRKIHNRLSIKKTYFNNQKNIFYKRIDENLSSQYEILKNQFFDNIMNNSTNIAKDILDNKIKPLINDWNNLNMSNKNKYTNEIIEFDKIILTANTINSTRSNTFLQLNTLINY